MIQKSLGLNFRFSLYLLMSLHSRLIWLCFLHSWHWGFFFSFTIPRVGDLSTLSVSSFLGMTLVGNWVILVIWLLFYWKSADFTLRLSNLPTNEASNLEWFSNLLYIQLPNSSLNLGKFCLPLVFLQISLIELNTSVLLAQWIISCMVLRIS